MKDNFPFCPVTRNLRLRYGPDRCKILCESPWIEPERTLSCGYHFRFGSLESALPHLLKNRPGLLTIIFQYFQWHVKIFNDYLKSQYFHQRMEAENISYATYSAKIALRIIKFFVFILCAANLDKLSGGITQLVHSF